MMNFDSNYARYYDLLYADKNYQAEAKFVSDAVQEYFPIKNCNILELGCGTGKHASILAQLGFSVCGIDRSEEMISHAKEIQSNAPLDVKNRLEFATCNINQYRSTRLFNAAISLFHVINYQTTNEDLSAMFETAATHLVDGGVFLFDSWYGPAVLAQKPSTRIKHLENENLSVFRMAEPEIDVNKNTVRVDYRIISIDKTTAQAAQFRESHLLRYLFIPEVELLLSRSGMRLTNVKEWMTGKPPGLETWGVCFTAIKTTA